MGSVATAQSGQPARALVTCFDDGRGVQALSSVQRAVIARHEPLVVTVDKPDRRWPQVCVYQFISATPEASTAVFVDYPLRPSYIPDVRESTVVPSSAESAVKRVAYVVHVFARMNEVDTLAERVSRLDAPAGAYRVDWHSLMSTMVTSIVGSATFVPFRNDASGAIGTLLVYDQFVEPGSRLAGLGFIRSRGIDAVRNAASAIARQVETESTSSPSALLRQITQLRRQVGYYSFVLSSESCAAMNARMSSAMSSSLVHCSL
jgi:hypothetical protein